MRNLMIGIEAFDISLHSKRDYPLHEYCQFCFLWTEHMLGKQFQLKVKSVFDSKADDAPQEWLDIQLTFISVQPPSTLYYATVNISQPSDSLQIL